MFVSTWLWMMQWFRISARDFHGKLQMSSLGKKKLSRPEVEKRSPTIPVLDFSHFAEPKTSISWFLERFWRSFVLKTKQGMPLRHIFETRKCWWLGMLVWSMPAMFWAKICQHSSCSFFMKKTMGLLDSRLKSGYFLTWYLHFFETNPGGFSATDALVDFNPIWKSPSTKKLGREECRFCRCFGCWWLVTWRSKSMAQIPKGRFVKGPYKPNVGIRDCAIYYFVITVPSQQRLTNDATKTRLFCFRRVLW